MCVGSIASRLDDGMRRQSLSLANMFSTLWRRLYIDFQYVAGFLRFALGGIHGVMPRLTRAAR